MKPHLIVLDLDGTLLTDDKVITEKTAQALLRAQEQGHYVMFATGRAYRATAPYYKQLNLNTPVINFNGAFVHHPTNNAYKTIHKTLPLTTVQEVLEAMQEFLWNNIIAEVSDDVYIHHPDENLRVAYSTGNPIITFGELQSRLRDEPTSMLINTPIEHATPIQTHIINEYSDRVGHRLWASPWGNMIELFSSGLSKGYGLAEVAKWMNIPRERIIAFGDENNDFEMIDYAGHGVAMANSIDELKSLADEVAPATNNEDGIALVLNDRLNLNKIYLGK